MRNAMCILLLVLCSPILADGKNDLKLYHNKDIVKSFFEQAAHKALNGEYGPLAKWQKEGYTRLLKNNKAHRISQTIYYPQEGFSAGEATAYGYGCSNSTAASNTLKRRTYLWIVVNNNPNKCIGMLRRVEDTGAKWNDRRWRAKLEKHPWHTYTFCWVDLWVPYPGYKGLTNDITPRWAVTE